MDLYRCDAAVIGAGAVGLAVARQLTLGGKDTLILEKNHNFGMETSARNSEIIHAGIYYPHYSLKAKLCTRGRELLYEFCTVRGIPHKRLGKLIVGRAGQESELEAIAKAAADNGVCDLQPLTQRQIVALEPQVVASDGLLSPSTGIIDSHQFMLALLGDNILVCDAEVTAISRSSKGWTLSVRNGNELTKLEAHIVVNAAGLWAQSVANHTEGLTNVPPLFLAKGSYAGLSKKSPFKHLVYPVPEAGGLGVHVTLDMSGHARFGPDVEWLETKNPALINYAVSPDIAELFAPRIAQWWPGIRAEALAPDYAGVRPKLCGPGAPNADFLIEGPSVHGMPGLINLFGIESPGLTASLAIAEHVEKLLRI